MAQLPNVQSRNGRFWTWAIIECPISAQRKINRCSSILRNVLLIHHKPLFQQYRNSQWITFPFQPLFISSSLIQLGLFVFRLLCVSPAKGFLWASFTATKWLNKGRRTCLIVRRKHSRRRRWNRIAYPRIINEQVFKKRLREFGE